MKKTIILVIALMVAISTISYGLSDISAPLAKGYIEGYVKEMAQNDKIKIETYEGTVYELNYLKNGAFTIDGTPVSITDFKPGMEVYGQLRGRSITYLESYSTENPGYIPPGGRVRSGIIKAIDRDQLTLKLTTGGEETYYTNPATIVLKQGQSSNLNQLYVGDRVILYFDEMDSSIISRINIEGDSIIVKDVYKGRINTTDELENVIVLDNIEVLRDGDWVEHEGTKRIYYSGDSPIYMAGYKVLPQNLKYYRGREVYAAVKDFFGQDRIETMVVKSLYESLFSEKITNVNWYTETMELSNNKNLGFNEGTMVVKNGRLVDKYSINVDSDALIMGDGRGTKLMADLVYILNEDINNSNIGQNYIYSGRLDQIVEYGLTLKDFFLLDRNQWESFDEDKEFYYDNDTYIFNLENLELIKPEEFYSEAYAVDETSSFVKKRNLRDWYGYLYTDGDRVNVVGVQKNMDSLLRQRITAGTIASLENDRLVGEVITLRDARDYSSKHSRWMEKSAPLRLNLRKALIIKEGKIIRFDELKPSDRLYIVRDDFEVKMAVVKQ